jgi:hypothetical protein
MDSLDQGLSRPRVLNQAPFYPPENTWQNLETFLVATLRGVCLDATEQSLQSTGQSHKKVPGGQQLTRGFYLPSRCEVPALCPQRGGEQTGRRPRVNWSSTKIFSCLAPCFLALLLQSALE